MADSSGSGGLASVFGRGFCLESENPEMGWLAWDLLFVVLEFVHSPRRIFTGSDDWL